MPPVVPPPGEPVLPVEPVPPVEVLPVEPGLLADGVGRPPADALITSFVAWLTVLRSGSHIWYVPALRVIVSRAVFPIAIVGVRFALRPVPTISSACDVLPLLMATNVSVPAGNDAGDTLIFPSRIVTLAWVEPAECCASAPPTSPRPRTTTAIARGIRLSIAFMLKASPSLGRSVRHALSATRGLSGNPGRDTTTSAAPA